MRCRLTLSRRATTVHTNSIRPLSNEGKSMAVIAVWQCDRDGSMFEDKKQAEEHDKYLELAANITHLIETELDGINESQSEIGRASCRERERKGGEGGDGYGDKWERRRM